MSTATVPATRWEVTFRGTFDDVRDWQRRDFATEAEAQAFAEGIAYGDDPQYDVLHVGIDDTPRCDLCGHAMECDREDADLDHGTEWNGETGNHVSCERGDR